MSASRPTRLADWAKRFEGDVPSPVWLQSQLRALADDLGRGDVMLLSPNELHGRWAGMIAVYRAVRRCHAALQGTDALPELAQVYYRLRSLQGALAMAFAMAGPGQRRPARSPLGTAIGMFDVPKILAQETHLLSGSYDADLPGFAAWMQEITTDMRVRMVDYVHFYGSDETAAAVAALARMLGTTDEAEGPEGEESSFPPDPILLRAELERDVPTAADLVVAVRAIEAAGHQARLGLVWLSAEAEGLRAWLGADWARDAAQGFQYVLRWPYPVGLTPILDLEAEQASLDELLSRLPLDAAELRDPRGGWGQEARAALLRACVLEQSVRDHPDAYATGSASHTNQRSFRWYVWELLNVVEQCAG